MFSYRFDNLAAYSHSAAGSPKKSKRVQRPSLKAPHYGYIRNMIENVDANKDGITLWFNVSYQF